jgi:hypothetical protein
VGEAERGTVRGLASAAGRDRSPTLAGVEAPGDRMHADPEWQFNTVVGSTESGGARLRHLVSGAELWVRDGRLIRGTGYRAAPAASRRELARAGAILRLRQRHRYHLHAAGAVDPSGRAWVLAGPTGSGKSTLAYALARAGWPILGDDGVIVEMRERGGATAYGWREPLRVSTTLSSVFPELGDVADTPRSLAGDARQRAELPVLAARTAPVAALVWLEQGPEDRVSRLTPTEVLVELVRQSAWVLIADGRSADHLDALRRMATEVPSIRLVHSLAQLLRIEHTLAHALP